MKLATLLAFGLLPLSHFTQSSSGLQADPPKICGACDEWNQPRAGQKVFGNTYTVGTAGLSAVLVTSPDGHILLDAGLTQSAPLVDRNIRALGFKTADVRYILTSHGHYDHVGGVAAIQRASGARVMGSASTAQALASGENTPDDPQFGFGRAANAFPSVQNVQVVRDGEIVRLGELAVTAHLIPGHAPGSTAWTWRSCEGATCRNVVYADSLTSPSADGFRYSDNPTRVAAFRKSIDTIAALPCDILLAPHPSFAEGKTCQSYAQQGRAMLEARLARERVKQ